MQRYVRSFSSPDEVIEIEALRSEMINTGGLTVSHDIHAPGWRWSIHVKPMIQTDWCQVHHVGIVLRGRFHVQLQDGSEFEAGPLDLFDVPPGHDGWVAGDESLELITWTGARGWLAPLESLAERILATVLFTDVVDSTATALRLGDRSWSDIVASLEARTRDVLGQFRGREVKMTGDGVLATFDGPARALRCALALRDAAAGLGLQIRIAVHTGEIELSGSDIRGVAVHEASRILGLAGSGEVLLSAVTASLAADAGFAFVDRGEHVLRGLPGPRRLFAIG